VVVEKNLRITERFFDNRYIGSSPKGSDSAGKRMDPWADLLTSKKMADTVFL